MFNDYQFNLNAVPIFIASIGTLSLGLILQTKKRDDPVSSHFLALCVGIFVWLSCTAMGYLSTTPELALHWFRWDNAGVMFISPSFFAFSSRLTRSSVGPSVQIGYGVAILFAALSIFAQFPAVGVQHYWWGYFPRWSVVRSIPFFLFFFGFMLAAFQLLRKALDHGSSAKERVQVRYVLAAFTVAYLGSVDYLPTFGHSFYPFGYIPIVALASILFFAVVKHRLLNIELVLRDTTLHAVTAGLIGLIAFLSTFPLVSYSAYMAAIFGISITLVLMMFVYDPLRKVLQPAVDRLVFANRFAYLDELAQLPNDMLEFTNLREMLKFLVSRLVESGRLKHAAVLMYDPPHQTYLNAIHYLNPTVPQADQGNVVEWALSQSSSLIQLLKGNNQRFWLEEDLSASSLESANAASLELQKFHGAACFGVMKESELVGVVILGSKVNQESFNHQDLKILRSLQFRLENFLLQAMVTTQESLNMVKDSHDMKNDVNALRGRLSWRGNRLLTSKKSLTPILEVLRKKYFDDKDFARVEEIILALLSEQLEAAHVESNSLQRLMLKLQNWSEYGRLISEGFQGARAKVSVDVTEAVRMCGARWQPTAEQRNISLRVSSDPGLFVSSEQSLIEQILDNLVDNALKATTKGSVVVNALREDHSVSITVQDTGCGFSSDALPTVLSRPFYQGKGRESLDKSTGIGLVLVNQYAKSIGGTVEIQSAEGQGTKFLIRIPMSNRADLERPSTTAAA